MGLVDPSSLPTVLDSVAIEGNPKWVAYLMRLISFELWLGSSPLSLPPPSKQGVEQDPSQVVLSGPHESEIRSN
jgi:hypothetical protein